MTIKDGELTLDLEAAKMTDWAKEPNLRTLKLDYEAAKQGHDIQVGKFKKWNDLSKVQGQAKPPVVKGRSSVQPKLIRRQAEWRYSALSEPFLSSTTLFKVTPVSGEDGPAARQNGLLLNHQFRTKLNRVQFIDNVVRSAVDEGTCVIQTGWDRVTVKVNVDVDVFDYYDIEDEERAQALQQALEAQIADPRGFDEKATIEMKAAIESYLGDGEYAGRPMYAVKVGTKTKKVEKIIENKPTAKVHNPVNVIIDPSCGGDLDKAMFVIVSFETCKADLVRSGKKYKNLDKVSWENATALSDPDHATSTPDTFNMSGARKKVVAYEYWGYYDIHGEDELTPIVATWIGDTLVRMEENPFPDQKLPFVVISYLPIKREIWGEPDAELLEDNQKVVGAVMRGMIDLLGRSANAQQGYAKGMLDPLNKRRLENGQDYEFNPTMNPQGNFIEHKYPELPGSGMQMMGLMNEDAEALTGVKSFSGGISGSAYGDVAAGIRGALDAASKREMAILRRVAKGIKEVGEKFAAMNAVFLSSKEVIRITNEDFIEIRREDLKGNFDFEVDISTAEVDNKRAQDLAFILQTVGPNTDPGIMVMIYAEIADLMHMPDIADKIRKFRPEPDPLAKKMQELEIAKLEAEIEKIKGETALAQAKAKDTAAAADQKNLDFVETETGTKHERDLERIKSQSQGNATTEVTKALTRAFKPGDGRPDIEAAIGYNELTAAKNSPRGQRPLDKGPVPSEVPAQDPLMGMDPAMMASSVPAETYADPGMMQ